MTDPVTPVVETVPKADFEKEVQKRQSYEAEMAGLKKQLAEYGMSATDIKAMKQAHDDLMREKVKGDPDGKHFDKVVGDKVAEARASIQKEFDAEKARADKLAARNKELEVTDRVFALAAPKLAKGAADDVKGYINKYGDLKEDGTIFFKDENGNPRYAPGSTTELMKPDQFVDWLQGERSFFFAPTIRSGNMDDGIKGGSGQPKKFTAESFRGMDSAQAQQAIKEGGAEAAAAYLSTVKLQ